MNRLTSALASVRPLGLIMALVASVSLTGCEYVRRFRSGNLGIFAGIILILDILAILDVFRQPWSLGKKLLWIVIIAIFPLVGLIAYYLFAGRGRS